MAEQECITEQLKADSQMEWVGRMNNIRSVVEEIVNTEIIFITSVAKDRKAPSGGKSRTREADDAAIFA